jgi:hypothetical protein
MKLQDNIAEAVSRTVENDVKLVHFYKEYDNEHKKTQERVELQLETFLENLEQYDVQPYMIKDIDLSKLISMSYRLMIDSLRAVKRAYDRRIRSRLIWVIVLVERYKQVPKKYQTVKGIKNLLLLFKTLYTNLVDKDIRLSTLIEDDLVLKIKQLSTQTASIFDDAMRDLIDSEETVENTKNTLESSKKEKASSSDDLLDRFFVK